MNFLKKNFWALLVICLVSFFCYHNINMQTKKIKSLRNNIENLNRRFDFHSVFSGYNKLNSNYKIRSLEGEEMKLEKIVNNKAIVLYINKLNCQSCIESAIRMVFEETSSEILMSNFIILAEGFNLRELKLMNQNKDLKEKIYLLNEFSHFFSNMQKANFPFYFFLNKSLETSNILFVENETLVEARYFSRIKKMITNSK